MTRNPLKRGGRAGLVAVPLVVLLAVSGAKLLSGASVVGSKHDLSTAGAPSSDEVCAYCHTPHHANSSILGGTAPLWNRAVDTTKVFTVYSSPTMNTTPGNPNGSISVLCLGCHDGTVSTAVIINGLPVSDKHEIILAPGTGPDRYPDKVTWPNCQRCHPDIYGEPPAKWQGTDLSNDHPIAMTYPTAAQDPKFKIPPSLATGWPQVLLYNGKVECPTCHNVHDPSIVPFLRVSNDGSQLCLVCHTK